MTTSRYKNTPVISVVMPVYNGEKFLSEAINSLLKQTYGNFELIIVNDGSTDKSLEIINSYRNVDSRIVCIDNPPKNKGLVGALNLGLSAVRGEFVARMDSDDICLANRFARQLGFLKAHPDVDLCGCWVKPFGKVSGIVWKYPAEHNEIVLRLMFNSAFAHPAVMFKRSLLDSGYRYDKDYAHAEDYELFTRLAETARFANVPEVLLMYRTHNENIGTVHSVAQQESARKVQLRELARKGISPSDIEMEIHRSLELGGYPKTPEFLRLCEDWLNKIKKQLLLQSTDDVSLINSFFERKLDDIKSEINDRRGARAVPLKEKIKTIVKKRVPSRYHKHFRPYLGYARAVVARGRRAASRAVRLFLPSIRLSRNVKPQFKIGYAILAYERPEYLEHCLNSLFSSHIDGYDITFLLQDDGSNDPLVKEIINKQRDGKYKIVRYFSPKGPSNAGAAINKALRKLMDLDDFDIIGWGDPDALYHPEWLRKTLEVCMWAKRNHKDHILGPFSSFNSSDADFHGVLGSYKSPSGKYVVKRQMGMLNYFYFKSDLLKLGYFDENPDDETLMTKRFERLGVRNFCTDTSYIEHIGQWSVLNQWRPVPVARAVHGLNLVSSGWPEVLAKYNTLGYYKDCKRAGSLANEHCPVPLSLVFVVTAKDFDTLMPAVSSARLNILHPIVNIYIVAPDDSNLIEYAKDNGLIFVNEDHILKTKRNEIQYRNDEGLDRSGWLFQQLLKYGISKLIDADHYLIIDADTVLIRPQRFFVDDKPLILHSDEFHKPYFDVCQRLLGFCPEILLSCVSHHMLFSKRYLAQMLEHIEEQHGVDWETAIRNCVDYSENSGFSEYETYGQWCMKNYPDEIRREYWFNVSMPRSKLRLLGSIIDRQPENTRSISFHSYL